jgi:putative ABC transport system permease protein
MNVFSRGIRNAFRNGIRTFSIVIILGLSIGLSLTMLIARQAVGQKIQSVKANVGNTITISPAGFRGFSGGGTALTETELQKVTSLTHVTSISESLSARLESTDTNLQSSVAAGNLGQRFSQNSGGTGQGAEAFGGSSGTATTFTLPVTLVGSTNTTSLDESLGGGTLKITSGSTINGSVDKDVAIVGTSLASKNNLKVGSTFTAYGTTVTVSGIFDAGNTFTNSELIMPLPTVQRLSSQTGDVTSAIVSVDSVSNLSSVTSSIQSTLGSSTADVTSDQQTAETAIAPLNSVKTISLFSLIGAVIAGSVIILLTMIMIVRERRREIGVTKAIGGSNLGIMVQFMTEAVTLTILGAVIGLIIGVIGGNPVTKLLVNNSTSTTSTSQTQGAAGGGQFGGGGGAGGSSATGTTPTTTRRAGGFGQRFSNNSAVSGIKNIHTAVGWNILLYGLGAAVLIALVGSALASGLIARVRPAEVMRAD